jgi:hypothetical protein
MYIKINTKYMFMVDEICDTYRKLPSNKKQGRHSMFVMFSMIADGGI